MGQSWRNETPVTKKVAKQTNAELQEQVLNLQLAMAAMAATVSTTTIANTTATGGAT